MANTFNMLAICWPERMFLQLSFQGMNMKQYSLGGQQQWLFTITKFVMDYNIDRVYHGSLIERLAKAHKQWFEDGCPFRKDTGLHDQVEFL
jgi:hypothetical protein